MINITICDDEPIEVEYLNTLVQTWAKLNGHYLNISTFESGESLLFSYEDNKEIDILLLDIQMKEIDGVTLAKKLRETNSQTQIVFITGVPDYIAEGYEVSALHYLMKPVKEDKLFEVLNRAVERLKYTEKSLLLKVNYENLRIEYKDVMYIESADHYVFINTNGNELVHKVKMSLSDVENLLDESFIRCQRSYIVGLRHIKKTTKTSVILANDTEIPISRGMYKTINEAIIQCF